MPVAGGLHQRVLRVAGAVAESAGAAEQGVEPPDRGDPRRVAADLWGATGVGGVAGTGRDAAEAALHDPQGRASGRGAGPGPAPFRGLGAEPLVGR